MFLEFYGLKDQPFGVTPDPRFLYLSPTHREALASLYYGIETGRGFLALIAKPGMGKTTLLFQLLERFRTTATTAFLFQTQCTSREFMRLLLNETGCETESSEDLVSMHEQFKARLLQVAREGRRFIVIIDEAQNLDPSVLESVRLLSDFETPRAKLLQIVLAGQPELADKLARPALSQLRQRISLLTALAPLPFEEVERYIHHRLHTAGCRVDSLFTLQARQMIAQISDGNPRNISNLCFNALSLGYALNQKTVDADIVREVVADFDISKLTSDFPRYDSLRAGPEALSDDHHGDRANLQGARERALAASGLRNPVSNNLEVVTLTDAVSYMREITEFLSNRRPIN